MTDRVLLTGISGFLGGHVALALLRAGYAVRSKKQADRVKKALDKVGADVTQLEFVELDLLEDEGWMEAARGCRYLQHTASPFVIRQPRDRNELIEPAVEGTRRAIEAALAANVEAVVVTSSIAAMIYGHDHKDEPFTEQDWTQLGQPGVSAYAESKTRAEQEAWRLMDAAGRHDDLAVINPGAILGPLLDNDPGTSAGLVLRMLDGTMPAAPHIALNWVDVRDVADLHVVTMKRPCAGGHRHVIAERTLSLMAIAQTLRPAFPDRAGKLPRFELPDWSVRLAGLFDRDIRENASELGIPKRLDSTRAKNLLNRPLISTHDSAIATARSLVAQGVLK